MFKFTYDQVFSQCILIRLSTLLALKIFADLRWLKRLSGSRNNRLEKLLNSLECGLRLRWLLTLRRLSVHFIIWLNYFDKYEGKSSF